MNRSAAVPEKSNRETPPVQEALWVLNRLKQHVLERIADQEVASGVLTVLAEHERTLISVVDLGHSPRPSAMEPGLIRQFVRLASLVAETISYLPGISEGPRPRDHKATWYHVHTTILDSLDDYPGDLVDRGLLAALEVTRGEVSEAYLLVRPTAIERLSEDCRLFFAALELGAGLLAAHLGRPPVIARTGKDAHTAFRSKYSGDTERYPIDIRTCVVNDIRRYFPGQSVVIQSRVFQAVQATYSDSIDQLCPEDTELFAGLLLAAPVLAFALLDADFSPEAFIDPKVTFAPNDCPTWGYAWTVSLSRMFFYNDGTPTEVARRTLASKQFGIFELLDGIVESMSRPWSHAIKSDFFQKCRKASRGFASEAVTETDVVSTIRNRSRIAQSIDPSFAWQQFGIYLDDDGNVKATAFSPWSVSRFNDWTNESQEHRLVRANIVQSAGPLSRDVLNELEWLISQNLPEAAFQRFLGENPSVLLALGPYRQAVPHIILHEDHGQKLIPDFFLEVADRRGADVVDLKLPGARIDLRQARRERFRAEIHEAVAQLRTYRDWFRSAEHRRRFLSETGIKCFLPRAIIVFGRSMDFQSHVDRQRLEATLPEWARLFTYDDLLFSARQWMRRTH